MTGEGGRGRSRWAGLRALPGRVEAAARGWAKAVTARSSMIDHLWRAHQRSSDLATNRLAAANAYYGFFAIFAMIVVGFAVLGQAFQNNQLVVEATTGYLRDNLPQLKTDELIESGRRVGLIAVVGLVIAGVAWVENLRISQRALWQLDPQPGNAVLRWIVDLGVLVGLGALLIISVAVFSGLQDLLLRLTGEAEGSALRVLLRWSRAVQSAAVDLALGAALLAGVPRLRMTARRLLPSAGLFAIGFGLLKTIGGWYLTRITHNPAYQVVAGTVGLLAFMYLLHRVVLFAAALAATSDRGPVVDLAHGKRHPHRIPQLGRKNGEPVT